MSKRFLGSAVVLLVSLLAGRFTAAGDPPNGGDSSETAGIEALPAWAIGPFSRPEKAEPVIRPNALSRFECPVLKRPVAWEARHTFNPAATVRDGRVHVLYRAEDDEGPGGIGGYTSRVGLASSDDGIAFSTEPAPVYFPADDGQKEFEWHGGTEDPRIVVSREGMYVLTFTQYTGKHADAKYGRFRIGLATSKDLRHWTKHGSPFAGTAFENSGIKSAGILQKVEDGRLVAARVNGKYWMYFGEKSVNLASSGDLIHWTPLTTPEGELLDVMRTRRGRFDSDLTEVGPPPLLTNKGIVLVYNGKNGEAGEGDAALAAGVYACGQALFDKDDPAKYLDRLDRPFFQPKHDWERSGQYAAGTTFAEGLVLFKGRWYLYYGCADTFVGVASAPYQP